MYKRQIVDTACSSGHVVLHHAAAALRAGECPSALVSSVSLKLMPHAMLAIASAGMLAADGRCKTFDRRANGYTRSEAAAAIVLAPGVAAGGALLLEGSAVRQDGRSASLTAPNGLAQRSLLAGAFAAAARSAIDCVEAHGTGTALGDPTEAGALAAVLRDRNSSGCRTAVGAAKANVGHTEPVSGCSGWQSRWGC